MQHVSWVIAAVASVMIGVGVVKLHASCEGTSRGNSHTYGVAIDEQSKRLLRGADTGGGGGVRRCLVPGTKLGCPGKVCTGSVETCVTCTNAATPFNDECTSAVVIGVICTSVTTGDCEDFVPPIVGSKGNCTSAGCTPVNPAVTLSCGVYAVCP